MGISKKYGESITYPLTEKGTKYKIDEFYQLLETNEDFKKELVLQITNKMNNDSSRVELDKTEAERVQG